MWEPLYVSLGYRSKMSLDFGPVRIEKLFWTCPKQFRPGPNRGFHYILKMWELFWICLLNSAANPAQFGLNWLYYLAGKSQASKKKLVKKQSDINMVMAI